MSVEIRTGLGAMNLEVVHGYLSTESYWARGIPRATVETALKNSLCFGAFHQDRQVGFARVVTDAATVAYLGDVFVLPGFRGRGIATSLLAAVHAAPELQGLRRWMLLTADAHDLYERFGWTRVAAPDRWMEKHDPHVYQRGETP